MKSFDRKNGTLVKIQCNQCGKGLPCRNGRLLTEAISLEVTFGYFSRKDGIRHSFDLCEECYDALIQGFSLRVEEGQVTELL